MAGEVTIHVVDITRGLPAVGMPVEIYALRVERQKMVSDFLNGEGVLTTEATDFPRGFYEVVFHVGQFFRSEGVELPDPPFLGEVPFRFAIAEPNSEYRLRMNVTPWGFSIFRER